MILARRLTFPLKTTTTSNFFSLFQMAAATAAASKAKFYNLFVYLETKNKETSIVVAVKQESTTGTFDEDSAIKCAMESHRGHNWATKVVTHIYGCGTERADNYVPKKDDKATHCFEIHLGTHGNWTKHQTIVRLKSSNPHYPGTMAFSDELGAKFNNSYPPVLGIVRVE